MHKASHHYTRRKAQAKAQSNEKSFTTLGDHKKSQTIPLTIQDSRE